MDNQALEVTIPTQVHQTVLGESNKGIPVGTFTLAVLPENPRFDVHRSCTQFLQPLPQFLRHKFPTFSEQMLAGIRKGNIHS